MPLPKAKAKLWRTPGRRLEKASPSPMDWETTVIYRGTKDPRIPKMITPKWVNSQKKRFRDDTQVFHHREPDHCQCLMPGNKEELCEIVCSLT